MANEIATAVTGGQGVTDEGQLAAITAATMLLGGGAAALLGQNPDAAATAAENETLNNTCAAGHNCGTLASARADTGRAAWNTVSRIGVKAPGMIAVMAPVGSGVKRGFERPQECGFLLDFATAFSPFSGIGLGLRKLSPSITMR
jgi:hypothetical protein